MNPTTTAPAKTPQPQSAPARDQGWRTVVWDDPVNLMGYVTRVFRDYFGYPQERAQELMLTVHERGRAVVSSGSKERMEADVLAMQAYGLTATIERNAN